MATDIIPTDLFPSYTYGTGTLSIDISDLEGLDAAEADAVTGDGRKVAYHLIKQIHAAIDAMAQADKPNRFIVATGGLAVVDSTTLAQSYSQTVYLGLGAVDVATETTTTTTTTTTTST